MNRAPVLSLWAAVVAERLGYDPDEAATLGEAVSVLNARAKGRRLGIFSPPKAHDDSTKAPSSRAAEDEQVELLGRPVPIVRTEHGMRAVIAGEVLNPQRVRRKWEQKFADAYPNVRQAMEHVAHSFRPPELAAAAYPMYERFRPSIPAGTRGWGARGELDLDLIRSLARRPVARNPAKHRGQQEPAARRRDNHPDRTGDGRRRAKASPA